MLRLKGNVKFIILVSESRILEIIGVSKREALLGSIPPTIWIFFFSVCAQLNTRKVQKGAVVFMFTTFIMFVFMVIIIISADHNYNYNNS